MKLPVLVATFGVLLASPVLAQEVTGLWQAERGGGLIQISRCGPNLCGKLVTSDAIKANPDLRDLKNKDPALRGRPLKNLQILSGFSGGPQTWTGGTIYNSLDGGAYSGTITLASPDALKLKGCIVAPLCKTQTWTRVK